MTDDISNKNIPQWLAVTGDVIRSRELAETDMNRLRNILEICNRKYAPAVPFSIQAGDEIQGLFAGDGKPLQTIFKILTLVFPMRIRWGIGLGVIDSPLRTTTADMRGPAFEYSRKALMAANKAKQHVAINGKNIDLQALNLILKLISGIVAGWDERTYRRYGLYSNSHSIYEVARQEGVSGAAINKHINLKNIRPVIDGTEYCDKIFINRSTIKG